MTVTRFAPSPTGRLHLGHAFSAMLAHDFARARGGRFLLRIEDIDPGRCREDFVAGIEDDLRWLGLRWDGGVRQQSAHLADYAAALGPLKAAGLVYPCFCTRRDVAESAAAPHGPEGPVYPGTCRSRIDPDLSQPHAWRLDITAAFARTGPLIWTDHGRTIACDPLPFGDVVLARKDAPTSYHLAVTVDDALQGVTDVVRGEDLFATTHIHRLLQALLDLPTPAWRHHPLLTGPDGKRLAKRDRAETLAALREGGADPAVILASLRSRAAVPTEEP